jgi:molecular chaperone IbpA
LEGIEAQKPLTNSTLPSAEEGSATGAGLRLARLVTHVALQEDMEMRTTDFTPYYRSSIGFDRMLDLLGEAPRPEIDDSWPPYDIERLGEDRYRITMAVAGFSRDEISITAEPNALLVEGRKDNDDSGRTFLHRGIAQRGFRRQFDLADFVKVAGASYENGILSIELEQEIPEAMKPRRIEISSSREPTRVADTGRDDKKLESAA